MSKNSKFYIVEASALPEIFLKVAQARELIQTGEAKTVNEATHIVGISRSAFYKYRDMVLPFENMMNGRVITLQLLLHDNPGQLSLILNLFAQRQANILTINSIVPTNGCAVVTISAETTRMTSAPWAWSSAARRAALRSLPASAREVPPYFCTIRKISHLRVIL